MRAPSISRWTRPTAVVIAVVLLGVIALVVVARPPNRTPNGSTPTPAVTPAGPIAYIEGSVTAGPVCPVERSPEPSECAPRPVAGAVIVVSNADQGEVARATTAADGSYRIELHGYGTFTLTPQPVQGLMRAPELVTLTVDPMSTQRVDFQYDTGIR